MDNFTASNGVKVTHLDNGDQVGLLTPGGGHFDYQEWVGGTSVQALREFFRAEEDERLGRWRWPENPNYVVYVADDAVLVRDESQPGKRGDRITRNYCDGPVGTLGWGEFAARAYFDAHPEPKVAPWDVDPRFGDAWLFTVTTARKPMLAVMRAVDGGQWRWAATDTRVDMGSILDGTLILRAEVS